MTIDSLIKKHEEMIELIIEDEALSEQTKSLQLNALILLKKITCILKTM